MITHFSISSFKNLTQIPASKEGFVQFGACNVLIGPNGCGKSSLLQAIGFLRAFFRSSVEVYLKEHNWDYKDLPNLRQTKKTIRWNVKCRIEMGEDDPWAGQYHYLVELQPRRYLGVGRERLTWIPRNDPSQSQPIELVDREGRDFNIYNHKNGSPDVLSIFNFPASAMSSLDPGKESDRERYPAALYFRSYVERFRSYLIWDPKVLRTPSRGSHHEIGPSGENLAAVLGRLKDQNPKNFERLVRRLKRLFSSISNISVAGSGSDLRTIRVHESSAIFNSSQMSDGILRLIAIVILLYLDYIPTVMTFEEPENGVHPRLVREVVSILRELTQRKPPNQCQVFMTTHSPYVLDEFYDRPEEVYCMERRDPLAGATIMRLSESRQFEVVRKVFEKSLGEAWFSGLIGETSRGSRP